MLPLPDASYSSCEMKIQSLNTFTYSQGYVVTKRRSAANATRLTNCPFTVYRRLLKADERWHLTQKVLVSQKFTTLRQEDLEQHAISKTTYNKQAHLRKIDSINSDFNHISCN
ncbi:hypothetical protein G9A89_011471 [Geosiphon pyriformis]|nr:hypothetical protein G9A89_011471 [Geosiphon pyriformis]